MSVRALLEELERLGVELRAAGDDLEYEGPEEAITPELLERLKAHKAGLLVACGKTNVGTREGRNLAETTCMGLTSDPEVRKLLAAGWEAKGRCGKPIWRHPDNGFYYSQEMAAHFLKRKRR
jgi:tubulysin polyketide synthase-like protein